LEVCTNSITQHNIEMTWKSKRKISITEQRNWYRNLWIHTMSFFFWQTVVRVVGFLLFSVPPNKRFYLETRKHQHQRTFYSFLTLELEETI
jgi:hypothetical protein